MKDIPGYAGRYAVTEDGKVWSHITKQWLTIFTTRAGYSICTLYRNTVPKSFNMMKVHRLVAMTYLKRRRNRNIVNHKNGIKTDNRVENLEWCSVRENNVHALKSRLRIPPNGEESGRSKLKKYQIFQMLYFDEAGLSATRIAEKYGVDRGTVRNILSGKSWIGVIDEYNKLPRIGTNATSS